MWNPTKKSKRSGFFKEENLFMADSFNIFSPTGLIFLIDKRLVKKEVGYRTMIKILLFP
jgi:hypothetical protein